MRNAERKIRLFSDDYQPLDKTLRCINFILIRSAFYGENNTILKQF